MNKLFFCLCMLIVGLAHAQYNFEIKGNFINTKPNTVVFLMNGSTGKTITTDTITNGSFILKGSLTEPDIFQIGFIGYKDGIDLFLFNNQVTLTGDFNNLKNTIIKGSSLNDDYQLFTTKFNPIRNELNRLAALINPEKNKLIRDSLISLFEIEKERVMLEVSIFTKEKNTSPVSPFVLYVISPLLNGPLDLENRYQQLDSLAKKGSFAREVEKLIAASKLNGIGTLAQNFSQKDTAGKIVSLASFKGQYILLDFWASWCGPCRMENPNVVKAYQLFKNKNFTVIGISLDESKSSWLKAIKKDQLFWTQLSDLKYFYNEVAQLYKVSSIPANFLIDPNGVIIAKDLRGEMLINTLKLVLK